MNRWYNNISSHYWSVWLALFDILSKNETNRSGNVKRIKKKLYCDGYSKSKFTTYTDVLCISIDGQTHQKRQIYNSAELKFILGKEGNVLTTPWLCLDVNKQKIRIKQMWTMLMNSSRILHVILSHLSGSIHTNKKKPEKDFLSICKKLYRLEKFRRFNMWRNLSVRSMYFQNLTQLE